MTMADALVHRLHAYGVRTLFGYPGGQMTPLYDALYRHGGIRHILMRHEQAAAFAADGYARASGRPGVALAVCGPGVFNAATPLATAFTDSVPFLLLSGQVPRRGHGLRSGYYHENRQAEACATLAKAVSQVEAESDLVPALDHVWRQMMTGRPGPALLEIPVDILRAPQPQGSSPALPGVPEPVAPSPKAITDLGRLVSSWRRPLILAGGGVVTAGAEGILQTVAERLGAPVFHTPMGTCALPTRHPLALGLPWRRATSDLSDMASLFSPLFAEADGLLAVGCRFSQLTTGSWTLRLPVSVAQIDVDSEELGRHYPIQCGVIGDARLTLEGLVQELPQEKRAPWAPAEPRTPWRLPGMDILAPLRRALPEDGIVVADVTRLAYILMAEFPFTAPRTFLHPAGFVSMGYGLPAALGARAAFPDRPVVAILGDGGFQMCLPELASAMQEKLPVVIVLINDSSLTLIKAIQQRRFEKRYLGVDLRNPDFGALASAYGVDYCLAADDSRLETALRAALASGNTALIEVRPGEE